MRNPPSECMPSIRVAAGGESGGCALSGAILRTASSRMPPERTMSTPQMVSERGAASPAKLPHGVVTVFGVTQDSRARPSSARMFMSRSDAATYCAQVASPQQPAASWHGVGVGWGGRTSRWVVVLSRMMVNSTVQALDSRSSAFGLSAAIGAALSMASSAAGGQLP